MQNNYEVRPNFGRKGRSLFASRDIQEGDIILEEDPLVSCQFSWNATYGYTSCDYCMAPLESAEENARRLSGLVSLVLPHPECDPTQKERHVVCPHCAVGYCTEECREKAWNAYHKLLCVQSMATNPSHPLERLNEAWKPMHYPPETATINLIARMIAVVRQSPNPSEVKARFLQMCHETVNEEEEIAHKLLGSSFAQQLNILLQLTSEALFAPEVGDWLTPEGFRSLFALIGRNSQGVGTSPFSKWVEQVTELKMSDCERDKIDNLIDEIYSAMDEKSGEFLNTEGSGLYLLQSSANHSCDPNASATFPYSNHRVVLKALKEIRAGEEICISYLDECALDRSRHSRQKVLKENYLFLCDCPKCLQQADQDDATSEEEMDDDDDEEGEAEM